MPKITIKLVTSDEFEKELFERLNEKKLDIESYILELIQKDITPIINLKNGFSFDIKSKKLFQEKEEVPLTSFEYKLLILLLNNANNFVTIKDLKENIWKEKEMTIFTLRNKIMSLRNKTYKELIKNSTRNGYMLVI